MFRFTFLSMKLLTKFHTSTHITLDQPTERNLNLRPNSENDNYNYYVSVVPVNYSAHLIPAWRNFTQVSHMSFQDVSNCGNWRNWIVIIDSN